MRRFVRHINFLGFPQKIFRFAWLALMACVSGAMFAACAGMGPGALEQDRNNYNIAIQKTNDEQLLLNLVRLKYRDTPFFLEVSSIATQFTFSSSADVSATFPEGPAFNVFGFGAGVARTERPTVSYSPLQGEEFIQRFLSPVSLKTISLLFHSGWSIDRISRLCFQHIHKIKNAPGASGPTPERAPEYEKFANLSRLFRHLQVRGRLEMEHGMRGGTPALILNIAKPEREGGNETREIFKSLGLPPDATRIIFSGHVEDTGPGLIKVETRSLLGSMFYLSQSVEAPLQDQEAGKVTITKTSSGGIFDWRKMTDNLMRVQSDDGYPGESAVAVKYRGSWFYIDDADLTSKSTFSMLGQIFSLQAGKSTSTTPVLTLPVGQ